MTGADSTTTLGATTVRGALDVNATGNVVQTGALAVTGISDIAATTGSIALSSPTNTFAGAVSVNAIGTGADVTLAATGPVTLGNVTVADSFDVNSSGNVVLSGAVDTGNLTLVSTTGDIRQEAGSTIEVNAGQAVLNAASNVTLSGNNDFGAAGLAIGNPGSTANITIDAPIDISGPIRVFGRDVTLDERLTTGPNSDILVSASRNFFNNVGADALNVSGTGRWIVYAGSARGNDYNNLNSQNTAVWNANHSSMAPELVPAGNRYVFNQNPIRNVLVATTNASKTYGASIDLSPYHTVTSSGIAAAAGAYLGLEQVTTVTLSDVFEVNPVFTSTQAVNTALVGSANIIATLGTERSIYDVSYQNSGVLTVNQRAITLRAVADSKVYGSNDPASYAVSITGGSLASDINDSLVDVTGTLVREMGVNAGQYDILLGVGSKASNYAIDFVQDNNAFTIQKALLSASGSQIYNGGLNFSGSNLTVTGVNGEAFTATGEGTLSSKHVQTSANLSSVAGLTLAGVAGASLNNYESLTTDRTSVTVTARALNLLAPSATKVYDANFLYEVSAADLDQLSAQLVGGDLVSAADVIFDNANVATGKKVTMTSATIDDGNDGLNYDENLVPVNTGEITKAPLTITAVDDADFVTRADHRANTGVGYAGVIYNGFVGGETSSVLSLGQVSRTNEQMDSAGIYENVLVPSGFDADNYQISYEAGDYTIVPANTLLVRIDSTSATYAVAPIYSMTAEYLDSDENTIIDIFEDLKTPDKPNDLGRLIHTGPAPIYISDGVGSQAQFNIAPMNPSLSSAEQLVVGGYNLITTDKTVSGANFRDLVLVGSLSIDAKELGNLGITSISKVYDGTNSIGGFDLDFNRVSAEMQALDRVSIVGNGTFNDRHVGTQKTVNIGLALRGEDALNYRLSTITLNSSVGTIEQLDSVRWVGPDNGAWSVTSHWAGGAIPDRDNVANIIIPDAAVSVYDTESFGVTSAAINNQGTVRFNSANAFNLNNNISGSGSLLLRGTGSLTLSGFNTLTGTIDMGSSVLVLGNNQALGQAQLVSTGGTLSTGSEVVLPSLRVDGDVTISSVIHTMGDQTYNGNLTFTTSGTATDSNNLLARSANFTSETGDFMFMGTVGAGLGAKNQQNNLVISAANGSVTFNDQVGFGVVASRAGELLTIGFEGYQTDTNTNPWAVDVLANTIVLNADITTSENQRYTGSTLVGDNGRNGFTRLLVSLDPSIVFDGSVDDTVKGQHRLMLRAIATGSSDPTPAIVLGDVGQITPLASLDVLTGNQSRTGLVAEINTDRTTFAGDISLQGSVKTVGNQTYTANGIAFGSTENPIVLNTELGTIDAITGLRGNSSNPIQGLDNTSFERGPRAPGIGANLRANAQQQGRSLNEKVVGRLPSEESEQFGSGMANALKRAIERSLSQPLRLDELQEFRKIGSLSAEVELGVMQDVTSLPNQPNTAQSGLSCDDVASNGARSEECKVTD